MSRALLAIVAMAAVVAAACSNGDDASTSRVSGGDVPMLGGNAAHTGVNPGPGVERWPEVLWRFRTGDEIRSSPAVVDGTVYVGSWDGYVYALDAATGQERWRFQTGDVVLSSPAVVNGKVYVGSFDGNLHALDAASGEERWRFKTGRSVESSPCVADGSVFFTGNDGNTYALDAATGQERWRFKLGTDVISTTSPAVADGVVYTGGDDYFYALDAATGKERWRSDTWGVSFSASVAGGMVYIGGQALDAATGEELWQGRAGGPDSSPAVVDGVLFTGSIHGLKQGRTNLSDDLLDSGFKNDLLFPSHVPLGFFLDMVNLGRPCLISKA